jgi:diguanylate cyclase (GGDEF)-like protein
VIVPLLSRGKTVGVFYYYLPVGAGIDERQHDTFTAIGQQLGMAIEQGRLYEEMRSLSLHDALTGLGNRRRMELMLDCELARVVRYQRPLSVLLVDIDYFKRYNDTLGHLAGDRLLALLGGILRNETREHDLAVRYGGEEFLLILPETPLAGAQKMAERLRQKVETQTPVTISIGAATALPARTNRDTLLQAADEALYQAKLAGRNRVESAPDL